MTYHPIDHRPEWETPVNDRGEVTGDTVCTVCGATPQPMQCVNCGAQLDETVWAHGSMKGGTHSTRKKIGQATKTVAVLTLLLVLFAALPALAWTVEDCEEVDYDHPHCDQYTTTTYQTTTTEPEVTTTTPNETTTTVQQQETTTTTAAPCPPGFDHQPPLCVNPSTTIPEVEVSSTVVTAAPVVEKLPFTGAPSSMLALASSLFLLAGLAVLGLRRREAD